VQELVFGSRAKIFVDYTKSTKEHHYPTVQGDWIGWMNYFLQGVAEIADNAGG